MSAELAYAVVVDGVILVDTVYDNAENSKLHYLSFLTGDYEPDDFLLHDGGLIPSEEFKNFPQASVVEVRVYLWGTK